MNIFYIHTYKNVDTNTAGISPRMEKPHLQMQKYYSKTFAESRIMQKLIIWERIIPENQDLSVLKRKPSGNLWTGPGKHHSRKALA